MNKNERRNRERKKARKQARKKITLKQTSCRKYIKNSFPSTAAIEISTSCVGLK